MEKLCAIVLALLMISGTLPLVAPCESADGSIRWTKHIENPAIWDGGEPWILYDGQIFRMWYSTSTNEYRICYADSRDGLSWTLQGVVLEKGNAGLWDDYGVRRPVVLFDGTLYRMWYLGFINDGPRYQIGYATSPDGIMWTKYQTNPVISPGESGGWDGWSLSDFTLVFDGTLYRMWYGGYSAYAGTAEIGAATSADGISWTKYTGNPVLVPGSGNWENQHVFPGPVTMSGSAYQMWYSAQGYSYPSQGSRGIGLATSLDGFSWTRYDYNPVLGPGEPGSWDSDSAYSSCIIKKSDTLFMWYWGGNGEKDGIGLAIYSPSGVTVPSIEWAKCSGNPLDLGAGQVSRPWVVYDGQEYKMWYTVLAPGETAEKICFADSPDGLNWAMHGTALEGSSGSWDEVVLKPVVLFDEGMYKMWYLGHGSGSAWPQDIGYATSSNGISWTKYGNPILVPGGNGGWDEFTISTMTVRHDGTNYVMWYSAEDGFAGTTRIGLATSPDGITWTKYPNNPILGPTSNSWESGHTWAGPVIWNGDHYEMWYTGQTRDYPGRIGLATSSDGFSWTKYENNPVLENGSPGSWDSLTIVSSCTTEKENNLLLWYYGSDGATVGIGLATMFPWMEADFKIHPFPIQQSTLQGKSAEFSIFVDPLQGFDSEVSLTLSGLPVGASYAFEPERSFPPFSSKLTIITDRSTPEGTYTLTATATGGGKTHSTTVTLSVVSLWINLKFDTTIPEDNQTYIQDVFGIIYPQIVGIYNYPSTRYLLGKTLTIKVHYDSAAAFAHYINKDDKIMLKSLPHPDKNGPNDPGWDFAFTHEFVHTFHDALMDKFSSYLTWRVGDWFEEGMTEATAEMTAYNVHWMRDITGGNRELSLSLRYYDNWNMTGGDILGGFESTIKLDALAGPYYSSAGAMWYILTAGLSTNSDNPLDFMSRLNAKIYNDVNGLMQLTEDWVKDKIREVAGLTKIEGKSAVDWLNTQSVVNTNPKSGVQLGVYLLPPYPDTVKVVVFKRPPTIYRLPITGKETGRAANVEVKILNSSGSVVRETVLTTDENTGAEEWVIPNFRLLPAGGYKIVAHAKIGKQELTAKNYLVSLGLSEKGKGPDTKIYGASLNSNGDPIEKSFSVVGGEILTTVNGAFTIETSTTTVPFEIAVQSEGFETRIAKPNPFTRVVFVTFPENPP